ncbi:MAG: hypothetical protein OCD01_14215 [Fibrobacterales bacterium]
MIKIYTVIIGLLFSVNACTNDVSTTEDNESSEVSAIDESSASIESSEQLKEDESSATQSSVDAEPEKQESSSLESIDSSFEPDEKVSSSVEVLISSSSEPESSAEPFVPRDPATFITPTAEAYTGTLGTPDVTVSVNASSVTHDLSKYMTGINSAIYSGNFSKDDMLIKQVRDMGPAIIRYPGGDASNVFFHQELPDDLPDSVITGCNEGEAWTDYHAGNDMDPSWQLTPDAYYDFIEATGAEGFITVNYPYARYGLSDDPVAKAAHEAAEWVRYDNGRTLYWEVGNETYACWEPGYQIDMDLHNGGQEKWISGALYAEHFKVFADSMRAAAADVGTEIYIGVTFADNGSLWGGTLNGAIPGEWNSQLAAGLNDGDADFVATHSYFNNNDFGGSGQDLTPVEKISTYTEVEHIEEYIYSSFDANGLKRIPLALTEWNTESPNQPSHANSLHALSALITMHQHNFLSSSYFGIKDQWRDVENWQGYQAMDFGIFNKADPEFGGKTADSYPYPTFYHFYYMNNTMGDKVLESSVSGDDILALSTKYSTTGGVGIVLVNKSETDHSVKIDLSGFDPGAHYYWYVVEGDGSDAFTQKVLVNGETNDDFDKGGPYDTYTDIPAYEATADGDIIIDVGGLTAVYLLIEEQ